MEREIVLNRHFVLKRHPVSVKPRLIEARSARRAGLHRRRRSPRPPDGRAGPSETPARANPAQGLASMSSYQSWFNRDGIHFAKPELIRICVRKVSSRASPGRARYQESISSFQSSFSADVAPKRRGSRLVHRSPSAFPYRRRRFPRSESHRKRCRPLGALFREKAYAQDAIRAVSRRCLCRTGIDRARSAHRARPAGTAGGPGRPGGKGASQAPGQGKFGPRLPSTGSRQLWFGRGKGRL